LKLLKPIPHSVFCQLGIVTGVLFIYLFIFCWPKKNQNQWNALKKNQSRRTMGSAITEKGVFGELLYLDAKK